MSETAVICPEPEPIVTRDWPTQAKRRQVRAEYVQGKGSLSQLARKHGLSITTIKQWSSREDWATMRLECDRRDLEKAMPYKLPEPDQNAIKAAQTPIEAKIAQTEQQLARIDELLNEEQDWKAIDALTKAKDRLRSDWALLTGFERPGIRKASRTRRQAQDIQPISPSPDPQYPTGSVQPDKPMGWEYDG